VQNNNPKLRIALAQINVCVGDIKGNVRLITTAIQQAQAANAQVLLLPELVLSGYEQADLVFRPDFMQQMDESIQALATIAPELWVIVGAPLVRDGIIRNAACVLKNGTVVHEYFKQKLPNYHVFDEKRWFVEGNDSCIIDIEGVKAGILICEDIWHDDPVDKAKAAGADVILSLNASPFRYDKQFERRALFTNHAKRTQLPFAYVNLVGGQDELVFDGASMLSDPTGKTTYQAPILNPHFEVLDWEFTRTDLPEAAFPYTTEEQVYPALVLGVQDYVRKNGFKKVLLGLSGGIDSALTLAIAADALGAENVTAIMMPFRYTAAMSQEDAAKQAQLMGVEYHNLPIENTFKAFESTLAPVFAGKKADVTEENLQARIRGVLLMSMSNKFGSLLLATSNKSETAVGYATLYGDMAGAFSPLKDVYKTLVYRLAQYRNSLSPAPIIPERVITRPPSAELAPGQVDQDSLPPYEVLDEILRRFMELNEPLETIVAAGFERETVRRVVNLVLLNEYKRRQAAPGVRITIRAFGKDWRYPMTSGWRRNLPLA
jgi:NAD+ synthetase